VRALTQLSDEQRSVLLLVAVQDLSYKCEETIGPEGV